MEKEEGRKGPWAEEEDSQLVFYVKLFGDRRWDFIAKVSGLKRTGKSCRLRWVNYLHPDLKRGKITPHEERLIIQLHSKWGNRWSRIARKLPGRTDNEIKNYWRTLMRKKGSSSSSSTSTSSNSSSASDNSPTPAKEAEKERSFYDTGGVDVDSSTLGEKKSGLEVEEISCNKVYSIDDIWKEIEFTASPIPMWDNYWPNDHSLWCMDDEQPLPLGTDQSQSYPFCNYMIGG